MAQSLEDLFKFVADSQPEKVQVLNSVKTLPLNGKFEHTFTVSVKVQSRGKVDSFQFEVGRVVADHELREDKKENSPEYEDFQRTLVSMFHRLNVIERRLQLLKQTKLPHLQIEIQG